ncbi:MAG TPA: hypothetical protein VKB57_08490 [Acidimicrobiales bacterium]|nr:hypothetical protein [Acidimicrobiales bacterium]
MAICSDPVVEALKDAGYNVLAVPREDFAPLLLLRSDGRRTLRPIGPLGRELASDGPLPPVRAGERASDLTVTRSRRLRGSLGVEVLGRLLRAVGAAPAAAVELSRESGTSIVLTGVTRDSIGEGDLAAYLEHDVLARTERTRRLAEDDQLYVVTAVLRSRALCVETSRAVAARVTASVPAAPGVAPSVEAAGGAEGATRLTYEGELALPFGFQAVQLFHRDGRWSNFTDAYGKMSKSATPRGEVVQRLLILDDDLVE